MKADLYTKTVLTVIALCLLWICVRDFVHPVAAQGGAQKVVIAGVEGGTPPIPIAIREMKVSGLPLSVSIDGVNIAPSSSLGGRIPISIEKVPISGIPISATAPASGIPIAIETPVSVLVKETETGPAKRK